MTDKEIIALVESKLPQELSLEEIDLIRRRMRASPAVRRTLAAQLELDQYLAGLIGKIELSPEAIFSGAGRSNRFGRGGILSWLGWTVCLLMMGFVVSMLVWAFVVRPNNQEPRPNVAQNGDDKGNPAGAKKADGSRADGNSAEATVAEAQPVGKNSGVDNNIAGGPSSIGRKLPVDPAGIVGGGLRHVGRIEISATSATRLEHLTLDTTDFGRGIGVLAGGEHGSTEFDFDVPAAGNYRLELRYAAAESRPLKLSLNGKVVKERAAAEVTGNEFPVGQRWFVEGVFALQRGKNTLRLEAQGLFPHVSGARFTSAVGEINITGPAAPNVPPWLAKDNLGAVPRAREEIAFDQFDLLGSAPSLEEARRWFTLLENGRIDMRDYFGARIVSIEGRLRLNAPLAEDSVLRLSVFESQWLALHFWHGKTGLTLRTYDNKAALVAYATSGQDRNRPIRVLAATDDDRNWRTNPPLWPMRLDIRFHNGLMVVSRGDVELLRAPYVGLPEEVIFEGHALIRGLALVRTTSELPDEVPARPIVADITRPADLKWESQVPQGMAVKKFDDGSVELRSQQSQQPGWMAMPLSGEGLGLHELIVEVDDVTPGSNVGLGSMQNDPKPKATIGFFRDNNSGGLSLRWNNYGDGALDHGVDFNSGVGAANAAAHFWLKFVGGCGLKCYTSIDGIHWARMLQPLDSPPFPLTHLAVWCPQGGQPRGIRVRRVTLRKLEAIESLAPPAEIMAKAPALPVPDFAQWEAEVAKRKPAEIGASAWRRACALKTLAVGGSVWAVRPVVDLLADEATALPASAEQQLKRLDELALLTNVWGDGQAAGNFMHRYERIAQRTQQEGNSHAWSTLAPAIARSPLWCSSQYSVGLERLARTELFETVYAGNPHEVEQLLGRMRLWNVQEPLLNWASDWATRHGENEPPLDRNAPHGDRRHPFIEELNKEGFNLLGDFQAAMASNAYHDACQIITSSDAAESLGLWPDAQDPQLLVSVNGAIDLAMAHDQQLRQTMIREFGPIGMLQVHQAKNAGDSATVAAVTARYRGTDAAAQACLWLGDRGMSTGDFAGARGNYERARKIGGAAIVELLAPRDRLAASMMGDDAGQPAAGPVKLGDVQLSAEDFEALVAEMRKAHAAAAVAGATAEIGPMPAAPSPSGFEAREIGRLDGEVGENPQDFGAIAPSRDQNTVFFQGQRDRKRFVGADNGSAPTNRGIDWAARQLAFGIDGDVAYVSNRFQVAAFDLSQGKRTWQSGVGGEHAHTHDWTLTSMRPIVFGGRLFVRRLVKAGPELAGLERGDGHVVWRSRSGLLVVSDPLWVDHGLVALTLSHSDQQSVLYLSSFDPDTGVVIAQERLATLHETWWQQRTCQLAAMNEGLVAVFGGTVLACDHVGKTRWVRRQEWISPQDDRDWARQYQAAPVVWQNRLYVTQPGVAAIECIDAESGELHWRKVLPGLKRLTGVVEDRLVVETQSGFVALSPTKGNVIWFHDVGDVLEGQLCGGPGKLLYTRREKVSGNDNLLRPVLVWLDPATGTERSSFPLDSLRHDHPMFGPFLAAQGKVWAFAGGGENEPVRTLYQLTAQQQAGVTRIVPDQAREIRPIFAENP